ncbi:hypothetical protein [Staphylococcus phage APTC_SA_12]|jgi:hypothetical protein|uniref:Uncharacterized protein n=19 Tax=Kayvirus TaxID=1857843 RepID=I6XJX9_9CAUD|nr:hypothetical protein F360_gp037 [Staphylococcus phage G15]YP_009098172.1 hypothetical protein QLX38_gp213 [Staphylococcus phage Team1]YP_009224448.1 hypothetical protein ST812_038 [Staphylococcus phage 812]YP_009780232.1 hypothetical protein QLX23_gp211 [Staphylococcus phage ISP]YP_009780348.1 hypothetical protein QLX37_gp075 [Staphylococcus phage SA5]YP_009780512.1 hypothetical protein QLX29_gp038 [Staphylococcus phage Staph1N]YP_009780742.1 hypothetical protein QLX30_gp036 [Staphylococcu
MKYILGLITLGIILFKVYEHFKYKQDEVDTEEDI